MSNTDQTGVTGRTGEPGIHYHDGSAFSDSECPCALTSLTPVAVLPEPSERVRLRELFGVSQTVLGVACQVGRKTVYAWEHGISEPTGSNRARYARILYTWAQQENRLRTELKRAGEAITVNGTIGDIRDRVQR
jgi:DNA-binding XRE family transcriptional regulator